MAHEGCHCDRRLAAHCGVRSCCACAKVRCEAHKFLGRFRRAQEVGVGGIVALDEAIRKRGGITDISRLSNKVTHVIMANDFETDDKQSHDFLKRCADVAPDAKLVSESEVAAYFT